MSNIEPVVCASCRPRPICSDCGTEIGEARLKAVPFAELCRDCQEAREERVEEERPRTTEPFARDLQ